MWYKYLTISSGGILLALLGIFAFTARQEGNPAFEQAKERIVLRQIGHQLLLQAGDNTSRVLPIKQLDGQKFQIRFETVFSFNPDSLVSIVKNTVAQNSLPEDYIVNVLECQSREVIFGFAVLKKEEKEIVPCLGREQEKQCYYINIQFSETNYLSIRKQYLLLIGILIAVFLAVLLARFYFHRKQENKIIRASRTEELQLGSFYFNPKDQYLIDGDFRIELTQKEAEVLAVFVKTPNHLIDRTTLEAEVWGKEGVIVGRSLDMFISKLRKKLKNNQAVNIITVPRKGYRLEIK